MIADWIAIGVAMAAMDFFYTLWTACVQRRQPLLSAFYSALIVLCGGFTIVEYTTNHILLVPAAIGAAIGTWAAIRIL